MAEILEVVPEGLAAASAQADALVARLVGVNASHAVAVGLILPPGADVPSVKVAANLQADGAAHQGMSAMGNEELGRSGMEIAESASSYMMGDTENVGAFAAAGGV